jgi:nucleoside-diphosphate-sugar epimerase
VSVAPEPRTVFVTGAAGSLGQRLLPVLQAAGWRTRCLIHRRPVPGADENVDGDLADPESLHGALAGVEAVLHLAALTHARNPKRYDAVNVAGTLALLASTPASVTRFVLVSSRAVSPEGGAYSRSKLAAEAAVRATGHPWVVVRLPEVYGAGKSEGVDDMIGRAMRGSPIVIVGRGDQELCPVHADDALPALVASLTAPAAVHETYTLAGDCMTVREFAEHTRDAIGSRSRIVAVPRGLVAVLGELARVVPLPMYPDQLARLSALKPRSAGDPARDLGFSSRPLDVGLRGVR